jgi:hypothetical protein
MLTLAGGYMAKEKKRTGELCKGLLQRGGKLFERVQLLSGQ